MDSLHGGSFDRSAQNQEPRRCALCEKRPASVFCVQDDAALCADCDMEVHTSSENFFGRHERVPIGGCSDTFDSSKVCTHGCLGLSPCVTKQFKLNLSQDEARGTARLERRCRSCTHASGLSRLYVRQCRLRVYSLTLC